MADVSAPTHRYQCIYCATPCDALYRVYGVSATQTIKLSRCTHCQRDVDPYCERELMLVILDCLLFREEAYRHFLFHRYRDLQLNTRESKILLLLASSCLRAYVISVAEHGDLEENVARWLIYFLHQTILSGIVYFLQWQCIFGCILTLAKGNNEFSPLLASYREGATNELFTQIDLSLLLPTACHVATIFVQIWEDSDTVRLMGSCLILAYQWFALNTIVRGRLGVSSSCSKTVMVTIVFVLSLLVRDVALELIRLTWSEVPSTICAGVELKIGNLWLPFLASKELKIPQLCLS
jgi:hypothetical protein